MRLIILLIFVLCIAIALIGLTMLKGNNRTTQISSKQALQIASEAAKDSGQEYNKSSAPEIILQDGVYSIKYALPESLPEGTYGPDYALLITIDAQTGKILSILGAS
jgi:hypothetical protein